MENDVTQWLQAEEASLLQKLAAVRATIAAYGVQSASRGTQTPVAAKAATPARGKVGIEGFGAYGRKVVAEAMKVMLTTNHATKTRDLVAAMEAMNVEITGENKINALGALLARSSDITSHGKGGWTLADRDAAIEIVGKYARKENEAPSEQSPEPQKPAGWGVQPPVPAPSNPNPWPGA